MAPVLNIPGPTKPKLCMWADISVHHTDQLLEETTTNGKKRLLKGILKYDSSMRSEILLDLFLHTMRFAKTHKYKKDQTSALFSIVKQTHEVCTSTPFDNIQECFQYFREMMLLHSVQRPPWSVELFDAQQLEEITAYVTNAYFRHYKLYKYAFTPKVRLDLSINYQGRAPSPEPIDLEEEEKQDVEPTPSVEASAPISPQSIKPASAPISPQSIKPDSPKAATTEPVQQVETSELELVVREAVTEQLKQMRLNVEKQLEDTDKLLNEKIQVLEQGPASPIGKAQSPKTSAKGKKK